MRVKAKVTIKKVTKTVSQRALNQIVVGQAAPYPVEEKEGQDEKPVLPGVNKKR
jgi:hypothetical protein